MNVLALALLVVGLLIDVMSFRLYVFDIQRRYGKRETNNPSGVPIVSLVFYWLSTRLNKSPLLSSAQNDVAVLFLFHICVQFFIPASYGYWLKKSDETENHEDDNRQL